MRIILFSIFIFTLFSAPCALKAALFSKVPADLRREVEMLENFSETRPLLRSLEKKGHITLTWLVFQDSRAHAFWSADKRLIALNSSRSWDSGEKLYSILFELHNALTAPQLNELDRQAAQQRISKQDYVEAVERIEYNNTLKASRLLERGVQKGYFPSTAGIPVVPQFKEHFKIQRECGHSGFIANKYEMLKAYPLPNYLK